MKSYFQSIRANLHQALSIPTSLTLPDVPGSGIQKIQGVILLIIGYLLSPLCWWNDLIFNLPLAYGFGHVCSWIWPNLLLPASIIGYWLSNIMGILLMQMGTLNVIQKQPQEHNLKKELMTGFVSSTAYTGIILLLMYFKILDTPQF